MRTNLGTDSSLKQRTKLSSQVLFCFFLGLLVRLGPEALSHPYLIGFDTVNKYLPRLRNRIVWSSFFSEAWLLYCFLIPVNGLLGGNVYIVLKTVAPILYGLNTAGIYYFAHKCLNWNAKKSLISSLLFSFNIASLRISWDLYRNMLGLAMLLFTIPIVSDIKQGEKKFLFVLLSILTVLSHEYSAITLLVLVIWEVIKSRLEDKKSVKLFALLSPSLVLFLTGLSLRFLRVRSQNESDIIYVLDESNPRPLGIFFLTNYLTVLNPTEYYDTYFELAVHILSLFAILYLIWLPLITKGFFRNKVLDAWTTLLLIGSFSALAVPFCAVDLFFRWMLMLVYPFTFYTTNGIEKILVRSRLKWSKTAVKVVMIATVLMGMLFMALPSNFSPFYSPLTCLYIPSTMQQNTIPLQDMDNTMKCLKWLNENMDQNSVLLVHRAFLPWARLYLSRNQTIIYYVMNLTRALEVAHRKRIAKIYLIWWSQDTTWYSNIRISENFKLRHNSGRIHIYTYS